MGVFLVSVVRLECEEIWVRILLLLVRVMIYCMFVFLKMCKVMVFVRGFMLLG